MKVWRSLLKKEWRLGSRFFYSNLIYGAAAGLCGLYFAYRFQSGIVSMLAFIAIIVHLFYVAAYLYSSISKERRYAPLWLQTPQPGWLLLTAKLTAGFAAMLLSLAVTVLFGLACYRIEFGPGLRPVEDLKSFPDAANELARYTPSLLIGFLYMAVLFAVYVLFAMIAAEAMRSKAGRLRWLPAVAGIALFIGLGLLENWVTGTKVYAALFHWGHLPLHADLISPPEPSTGDSDTNALEIVSFGMNYVGDYVFELLAAAALFWGAGRLFDRKVEVQAR